MSEPEPVKATAHTGEALRTGTAAGRWVLLATVLGSGIAFLDSTVVNVALPAIGEELDAGLSGLQWIVTSYLLTLAALILLAGSLSDRYGRRRVFLVGVTWFAIASLLCGLAPNVEMLVAARALQGVGGALLTPGSLAILQASFHPDDRAKAIGAWSGMTGIAAAVGPFLGGWLIASYSWRLVFFINLPLAAVVIAVSRRHVPETKDPTSARRLDIAGAVLGVVGLAALTYALIEAGGGIGNPLVIATGVGGALVLATFLAVQARSPHPMMPLGVFRSRQFSGANLVTVAVYASLSAVFFLLIIYLQQVAGYSPIAAGAALLPVTGLMLFLSSRAGALATRIGPRLPMTLGPLVIAIALLMMSRIGMAPSYLGDVLPGAVVFGLGLSLTVAPLTATVLAAVASEHAGIASGINNAVARAAGLLAVAILPLAAGLTGDDYRDPAAFAAGFTTAMQIAAGLCAAGAATAWLMIRNPVVDRSGPVAEDSHCALDAPPLRPPPQAESLGAPSPP